MSEHKLVDGETWAAAQVDAAARGLLLPEKRKRGRKPEAPVKIRGVSFRPRLNGEALGPDGRPGEWFACYVDGTGLLHREKAGTKSAALALYQRRKSEVRTGKQFPENLRRAQAPSFKAICESYLAGLTANGQDKHGQAKVRLREVQAIIGLDVLASSIRPQDIEACKVTLAEAPGRDGLRKPATVNLFLTDVRAAFNAARRLGLVDKNPAADVHPLRADNKRVRELTGAEEQAILAALRPAYRPLVRFLILTGLRVSEACGLRWADVDFKAELLTLRETKAGARQYAHLNGEALGILRDIGPGDGEGYVFLRRKRKAESPCMVTHAFQKAAGVAGVTDVRLHDTRHTFASRALRNGVGIYTVSKLLRHASVAMSERYSHLSQADLKAAIQKATDTCTDTGKKATS